MLRVAAELLLVVVLIMIVGTYGKLVWRNDDIMKLRRIVMTMM